MCPPSRGPVGEARAAPVRLAVAVAPAVVVAVAPPVLVPLPLPPTAAAAPPARGVRELARRAKAAALLEVPALARAKRAAANKVKRKSQRRAEQKRQPRAELVVVRHVRLEQAFPQHLLPGFSKVCHVRVHWAIYHLANHILREHQLVHPGGVVVGLRVVEKGRRGTS